MIKQMAWNTFKKTGSIDSYLELVELENMEKNKKQNLEAEIKVNKYGNIQNEGNNNIGEQL